MKTLLTLALVLANVLPIEPEPFYGEGELTHQCADGGLLITGYAASGDFEFRVDVNGEMEVFSHFVKEGRQDLTQFVEAGEGDHIRYILVAVRVDVWDETGGGQAYVEAGGDQILTEAQLTLDCQPDARAQTPSTLPFTGHRNRPLAIIAFLSLIVGLALVWSTRKTS